MKKIIGIGIVILALAMATPAMAFQKGTIRLGAGTGLLGTGTGYSSSSLDFDSGGSSDIDTIAIGLGYFFTDIVEASLDFSNVDIGGEDLNTFGIGGKYYFPMNDNYLYAGGGFQTIDAFGGDGDLIYITGGFNYMLKQYFSIDFYLAIGQGDIDGNDFDMTDIGVTYSIYFF